MIDGLVSKSKNALAAMGVVFCVAAVAMLVMHLARRPETGPSSLILYPENQEQIVSERRARELQSRLGLTEDQVPAVTKMIMEIRAQSRTLSKENAGSPMDRMQLRMNMMQEMDRRLPELLTPEQSTRYEEMRGDLSARVDQAMMLRERFRGWIGP